MNNMMCDSGCKSMQFSRMCQIINCIFLNFFIIHVITLSLLAHAARISTDIRKHIILLLILR